MIEYLTMTEPALASYLQESRASLSDAVCIATYTDRLDCLRFSDLTLDDAAHLLELRAFCAERELLCRRDYMGEDFCVRLLDDQRGMTEGMTAFDETHFLDQDEKRTESLGNERFPITRFYTMGGGKYELPFDKSVSRVRVRTYFASNEQNGIEYPVDWRVVEID